MTANNATHRSVGSTVSTVLPRSTRSFDSVGFTVVELLITATIFIVILAAIGGLLVSSTRAYGTTAARTEAIQDSEAVLQLMRYEVAMAGYRGIEAGAYARSFTTGSDRSIIVHRTPAGDELTMRYFEDRYLGSGDSGERVVTFRVDSDSNTLVRVEGRPGGAGTSFTTELLVGNIAHMEVAEVVDRFRERFSIASLLADPGSGPELMAGVNVVVTFVDGLQWEFLIGVSNAQTYAVTSGV